jgi:hypothetical protein
MGTNVLLDKSVKPDDEKLSGVLGETYKLWSELKKYLASNYPGTVEEWKNYDKYGWNLKILLRKRNLFFLIAYDQYFKLSFVFGDKAVSVVEKSGLPDSIITQLRSARKYMEGRGISIEIKSNKDVGFVKKLIDIKVNN